LKHFLVCFQSSRRHRSWDRSSDGTLETTFVRRAAKRVV
jgi:hypothetical protein